MAMWPKIKFILSASFLSLIIGLIALYYTIRGTKISLVADVTAESNVMDVRTPLRDLAILFQGEDVQKENLNLKILSVRLVNEGEANILENYFDSRIPWGLRVDGGRLIEARITGSNSQYLSDSLHPRTANGAEVTFDKIIFDRGKYVALELLVLHNKGVEPQVKPFGKIAGMDNIPIRNSFRDRDQEGFSSKVFRGPIAVQIARTIAYFLIGLATAVAVGFSIFGISTIPAGIRKRSRLKRIGYLAKEEQAEKEKKRQALLHIFVEDGLPGLKRTRRMMESNDHMAKALPVWAESQLDLPPELRHHITPDGEYVVVRSPSVFRYLEQSGLVKRNGSTVEVDPEARELASSLIEQLSEFDEDADARSDERPRSEGKEK